MQQRITTLITTLTISSLIVIFAQEKEAQPDPWEWIIETYQMPADDLGTGFASPDRGALVAPAMPGPTATDKEIEAFVRKSSSVVTHYFQINGLTLPKGSLVIFDPESYTVVARLPRIAHSSLRFNVEAAMDAVEKYISSDYIIIEAPADTIRDVVRRAGESYDHSGLLKELEQAAEQGDATILTESLIECRSGNRSKVSAETNEMAPIDLLIDSKDQIGYVSDLYTTGSHLEIDPVLGSDNTTIDLSFSGKFNYAPNIRRQANLTQRGKAKISNSVTDAFDAIVTSQYTTRDGKTKMLGVWKPEALGNEQNQDVLQASFITSHVVRVMPLLDDRLTGMLEKHGEAVLPTPEGKPKFEKTAEEIPEGMIVRRYVIPPSFLSTGGGSAGGGPVDPFAGPSNEPRFTIRATAKDVLKSVGIFFPAGSSANYLPGSNSLVVRNVPEQIELVEAYIMSLRSGSNKSIAITLHIVQGPSSVMRAASRQSARIADHTKVWEELTKNEKVSILTTNWIEGRSGNRVRVESGLKINYPIETSIYSSSGTTMSTEKGKDGKESVNVSTGGTDSKLTGTFEVERVGTIFEADSVLGADGKTIDLNISVDHDYALPTVENLTKLEANAINLDGPTTSFHQANVVTQVTLRSGMIRMVGMWKPEGAAEFEKADVRQAAFIKTEVVALEDIEK